MKYPKGHNLSLSYKFYIWVRKPTKSKDIVVLFLSCHSVTKTKKKWIWKSLSWMEGARESEEAKKGQIDSM